jgi:hypothetical protein
VRDRYAIQVKEGTPDAPGGMWSNGDLHRLIELVEKSPRQPPDWALIAQSLPEKTIWTVRYRYKRLVREGMPADIPGYLSIWSMEEIKTLVEFVRGHGNSSVV